MIYPLPSPLRRRGPRSQHERLSACRDLTPQLQREFREFLLVASGKIALIGSADPAEVDYGVAQRGLAESTCVPEEKYAVAHKLGEEGELTP